MHDRRRSKGLGFVVLAAAACAAPLPKVEHRIVGRVLGVEGVPAEKIVAYPRSSSASRGEFDRIAWLRVRWERPEEWERARRALFEEASRFGADVILDYEETIETGGRATVVSLWRTDRLPNSPYDSPPVIRGAGGGLRGGLPHPRDSGDRFGQPPGAGAW